MHEHGRRGRIDGRISNIWAVRKEMVFWRVDRSLYNWNNDRDVQRSRKLPIRIHTDSEAWLRPAEVQDLTLSLPFFSDRTLPITGGRAGNVGSPTGSPRPPVDRIVRR